MNHREPRRTSGHLLAAAICIAQIVIGQVQPSVASSLGKTLDATFYPVFRIPAPLRGQFEVLGDRLQKPGKERVTFSGALTTTGAPVTVQVVMEKGGKVRITGSGKDITFDGSVATGVAGTDQGLIEALADDTVDTLMDAVVLGFSVRLLGRRFPYDSGFCDFYDMWTPSRTNQQSTRLKRYCFDSKTRLLRSVRYLSTLAPNSPMTETRFEDWRQVNGQAVPGRVTRREANVTIFTLQAGSIGVSARVNDSLFPQK